MAKRKTQFEKSMEYIEKHGVRGLDRNTLKKIGLPIVREVRKRLRALEKEDLTDSPAYRFFVYTQNLKATTAGKDINKIKHEVMESYKFLTKRTSTVEGAKFYNEWIEDKIMFNTTSDQRRQIWDMVHKMEEIHPNKFENFEYNKTIKVIAYVMNESDYDEKNAFTMFKEWIDGEIEFEFEQAEKEKAEYDEAEKSPWFKKDFTKEF